MHAPSPPISDPSIVSKELGEGPSIQPFHYQEPHPLGRSSSAAEFDDIFVPNFAVHLELRFNLVYSNGHVLALGLQRLDNHGLIRDASRVNPRISAVSEVFYVR